MSIDVRIEDGIAELLLNHPPVNALDSRGWAKLAETVTGLRT